MTPKSNLKLRKLGSKYMIVENSDTQENLANVYSLNETAARLWEMLCNGDARTPEELAEALCRMYNVEKACALQDVERQLAEWEEMGLLVNEPDAGK